MNSASSDIIQYVLPGLILFRIEKMNKKSHSWWMYDSNFLKEYNVHNSDPCAEFQKVQTGPNTIIKSVVTHLDHIVAGSNFYDFHVFF